MRKIDRFMEYCKVKGISSREATRHLDISNGLLEKTLKPGKDLSSRLIGIISNTYKDLNINWLLTGEGEMISNTSNNHSSKMLIARLKYLIKILVKNKVVKSQEDLGAKLGYSGKVYISRLINGKVDNSQFIEKLLIFNPQINKEWLFTGQGSMLIEKEIRPEFCLNSPDSQKTIEELEEENFYLKKEISRLKEEIEEYKKNDAQNLDNFFQLLMLMNEKVDNNTSKIDDLTDLIKMQQSA